MEEKETGNDCLRGGERGDERDRWRQRGTRNKGIKCGDAVDILISERLGAFVFRLFTPKRKSLLAPLCFSHNPDLTHSHI